MFILVMEYLQAIQWVDNLGLFLLMVDIVTFCVVLFLTSRTPLLEIVIGIICLTLYEWLCE